jgi:hypothetical protein
MNEAASSFKHAGTGIFMTYFNEKWPGAGVAVTCFLSRGRNFVKARAPSDKMLQYR